MKSNQRVLSWLPNPRCIVTNSGVKIIGKDSVCGVYSSLNLSKQSAQYAMIHLMSKTHGKQYA